MVFDKTGTVTRGKPSVTDCRLFTDRVTLTLPQLCRAVGAAEATSEHPLAKALLEFCKAQLLLSEGAECIGALHPAATSTSSFSAGELGAFPTAAAAVPSAVVAALSKEVANSSHHYASLAALLPKPQTVQVQPGFGITCTLTWDQVTGSTSSIPTGLASLKSLSAGSGSVPSSEAHQRRSVHGASGGGAAGASSQRSSGAGIGPSSSKGSASGSSVVKVAVGNRALMTQEYVDVPEKVRCGVAMLAAADLIARVKATTITAASSQDGGTCPMQGALAWVFKKQGQQCVDQACSLTRA